MEQIAQLIDILKQTPEMALWGISIFLAWRLLTLASWVGALTVVAKLGINKYFTYKERMIEHQDLIIEAQSDDRDLEREKLAHEKDMSIAKYFKSNSISSNDLTPLIDVLKSDSSDYIHSSDINKAVKVLLKHKDK